jgi:hypothetical protein
VPPTPEEAAIGLRTALGLSTDAALIAELAKDDRALARSQALGVPLGEPETTMLQSRFDEFGKNEDVYREVLAAVGGENYGGNWYDQVNGVEVIAVLAAGRPAADSVVAKAPVPARIELRTVEYSQSTLDAALNALGKVHSNGYTDVQRNQVVVVVTTDQAAIHRHCSESKSTMRSRVTTVQPSAVRR